MLDKAIYYGKEHRKAHKGAKSFDRSCRNHGQCPHCESGRQHQKTKENLIDRELKEELS